MKYKVGDKVKIKSFDWYNENKNKYGIVDLIASSKGVFNFIRPMATLCGKVATIMSVNDNCYDILEDVDHCWTDEMIEGLAEEETNQEDVGTKIESTGFMQIGKIASVIFNNVNYENEVELQLGDYEITVRDGKTYAVKKKPKYPKTYEECAKIMNCPIAGPSGWLFKFDANIKDSYYRKIDILMGKFTKLLICRDAYWKIAGEELGLGGPWEPDFNSGQFIPAIIYKGGFIQKVEVQYRNVILAFPTTEMRDAFYDNFKEEIEQCKELL